MQDSSSDEMSCSLEVVVEDDNKQLVGLLELLMGVTGREMREFLSLSSS